MNGTRSSRGRAKHARRVRPGAAFGVAACVVVASFLALAGVLGGCGGDDETGPPVYTEADNGSTVRAAVGDEFTIRLTENPSTGYTWTLSQSSGLKLLGDELEEPTESPDVVGAPGTRVFEFEVAGTGTQLLQAVYSRPWEAKDDAGTQEFTLTVEVE